MLLNLASAYAVKYFYVMAIWLLELYKLPVK